MDNSTRPPTCSLHETIQLVFGTLGPRLGGPIQVDLEVGMTAGEPLPDG